MDSQTPTIARVNGQQGPQTVPVQTAQPATGTPSQWCTRCGTGLAADVRFCHRCGSPSQSSGQAEPEAVVSAPAPASPELETVVSAPAPASPELETAPAPIASPAEEPVPVAAEVSTTPAVPEPFPAWQAVTSFICGFIGVFVFTPVAAVAVGLGFYARKTNRTVGNWLIGIGIGSLVLGTIVDIIFFTPAA